MLPAPCATKCRAIKKGVAHARPQGRPTYNLQLQSERRAPRKPSRRRPRVVCRGRARVRVLPRAKKTPNPPAKKIRATHRGPTPLPFRHEKKYREANELTSRKKDKPPQRPTSADSAA